MKIQPLIRSRFRRQRGSIVLILVILLVIMTMLAAASSSALSQLHQELNLLDRRQVGRLDTVSTNAAAAPIGSAKPESK
jgi:Tfp pilus assembly protein PilX